MANAAKVLSAGYVGIHQLGQAWVPDTTQRFPLGTTIQFVDPYWGEQTAVYLKVAAAGTVGALKKITNGWVATATADEAGIGYPLCVAMNKHAAANEYGWFLVRGRFPVRCAASVAVGTQLAQNVDMAVTMAATKGIQGMVVSVASASNDGTITDLSIENGSTVMTFTGSKSAFDYGLFVGQKLTGTGLGTNTQVASISPDGNRVTVSVASTATSTPTITKTLVSTTDSLYWNICTFNNPISAGVV